MEFSQLNTGLEFGNFDPEELAADEVINVVMAIDVSLSMRKNKEALNKAYSEFINYFKGTHIAEKLLISRIEFNSVIETHTGFQPISELGDVDFGSSIRGCTAMYDAVKEGLSNALQYREDCEDSGINCKTLLFVLTDGDDNDSQSDSSSKIKAELVRLKQEERNFASFTTILLGLGEDSVFRSAAKEMDFDHVATASDSSEDIRKMITFISTSISSVSSGQGIPDF